MDLHGGAPWWLIDHPLPRPISPLAQSIKCEVLIIGAGITGALVADRLARDGREVVVIDRREPGLGSTAASTGLLQYEIDVELCELIDRRGVPHAVRAYHRCLEAIGRIGEMQKELGPIGFEAFPSLYLASRPRHRHRLIREAALRQKHGLPAQFVSATDIEAEFGVPSEGGILSTTAAVVDPLELTRRLLARAHDHGARVYGGTTAEMWVEGAGGVEIVLGGGSRIEAEWLVFAGGYEVQNPLRHDLVSLHSTFALVTDAPSHGEWARPCLIWESARPYTYLRPAAGGRVMIGGGDVGFRNARLRDRLIARKTERLERRLEALLPGMTYRTAYTWAGTFGATKDGLPYIGPPHPGSHMLYALGYGGNGITFSVIAAELLADRIGGIANPDAAIFALDRDGPPRS